MIFLRHVDFLPDTMYVQMAAKHGKAHYFDHMNPNAGVFNIGKFLTELHHKIPPTSTVRKGKTSLIILHPFCLSPSLPFPFISLINKTI